MWTCDLRVAMEIFEKQFNEGRPTCIETVTVTAFGNFFVCYCGKEYRYSSEEEKWIEI